nr:MAG TPA: Collagenase [Caudoviricetes sp.]
MVCFLPISIFKALYRRILTLFQTTRRRLIHLPANK